MVVIAVVDDDTSILDAMTLLLEGQGWDARVYPNGETFLANYHAAGQIDCVILDPHLGEVSGFDVAKAIAGTIPIIGLTAWPESPITRRIQMLGVEVMLTKPVTPRELIEHIHKAT